MKVRLPDFLYASIFGATTSSLWVFGANQEKPESIIIVALILGLVYSVIGKRFWALFGSFY